jgi:hypothetical protein
MLNCKTMSSRFQATLLSRDAAIEDIRQRAPPLLFKYRDWNNRNHRRLLEEHELYFPSPSKFNDPYDCGLPFRQAPSDFDPISIKEKLEGIVARDFPDIAHDKAALEDQCAWQLAKIMEDPSAYFSERFGLSGNDLAKMYGVLSLATAMDNFLMWSHYSDCHKGFAVGFETGTLYKDSEGELAAVDYTETIPEISVLNLDIEVMHNLIYTKSLIWEYENEYRITRINKPNTIVKFSPAALRKVYFGVNMPHKHRVEIIEILKVRYSKFEVFDMVLNKESFKLDAQQIYWQ